MDVLKQIAHLEALKKGAEADGEIGMALYYQVRVDELKGLNRVGHISESVEIRTGSVFSCCDNGAYRLHRV